MVLLSFLTHFAVGTNLLAQIPLVNSFALHGRATLDDFIASESPIALQGILNNIGSAGSNAVGVALGLVVASPTKENPDCMCRPFLSLLELQVSCPHQSWNVYKQKTLFCYQGSSLDHKPYSTLCQ
jgi:hypothetical protein